MKSLCISYIMDIRYTIQILNLVIQALPPPPVFVRLRSLAIHPHIPSFSSPIKSERVVGAGGLFREVGDRGGRSFCLTFKVVGRHSARRQRNEVRAARVSVSC